MSQFEEIPSPGYGFQGSRVRKSRALAACKTLASNDCMLHQVVAAIVRRAENREIQRLR